MLQISNINCSTYRSISIFKPHFSFIFIRTWIIEIIIISPFKNNDDWSHWTVSYTMMIKTYSMRTHISVHINTVCMNISCIHFYLSNLNYIRDVYVNGKLILQNWKFEIWYIDLPFRIVLFNKGCIYFSK